MDETQVVDINDRNYWTLTQLASAFGPARETVSKRLKQANVTAAKKRGNYDVFHIASAARAILADERPPLEKIKDPDLLHPKDRLDYYRGENEKTKCLKESGVLIPVSEVTMEFSLIVKACIRTLETLPDILEIKCALKPDEVILIEHECDLVRAQLADELTAE
ncbi:MAG: DUF1441 family protein [Flavobacteriales bacterium]|nr:DUF1441 family protein [Flavobacteriales bacterium]